MPMVRACVRVRIFFLGEKQKQKLATGGGVLLYRYVYTSLQQLTTRN